MHAMIASTASNSVKLEPSDLFYSTFSFSVKTSAELIEAQLDRTAAC